MSGINRNVAEKSCVYRTAQLLTTRVYFNFTHIPHPGTKQICPKNSASAFKQTPAYRLLKFTLNPCCKFPECRGIYSHAFQTLQCTFHHRLLHLQHLYTSSSLFRLLRRPVPNSSNSAASKEPLLKLYFLS